MIGTKEVVGCEAIDGVLELAEYRSAWRSNVAHINVYIRLQ